MQQCKGSLKTAGLPAEQAILNTVTAFRTKDKQILKCENPSAWRRGCGDGRGRHDHFATSARGFHIAAGSDIVLVIGKSTKPGDGGWLQSHGHEVVSARPKQSLVAASP